VDLLLIHGFPFDRTIWEAQAAALSSSFRVIAPDLRGFGGTPGIAASIDDYAMDMLQLLDRLGLSSAAVAGHSMGGYVLFSMLRLAPERVSAAAFVSSRASGDSDQARSAREENARRALAEGTAFLADSMTERLLGGADSPVTPRIRQMIRAAPPAGVAAALRAMAARPDSTPLLSSIRIPCLVVAGRRDKIVPPAESESMSRSIPGARLLWFENSGHMPMLEEPDRLSQVLREFLS
jgi:pimeloyl-ACP methyl ester carboxylesterase